MKYSLSATNTTFNLFFLTTRKFQNIRNIFMETLFLNTLIKYEITKKITAYIMKMEHVYATHFCLKRIYFIARAKKYNRIPKLMYLLKGKPV